MCSHKESIKSHVAGGKSETRNNQYNAYGDSQNYRRVIFGSNYLHFNHAFWHLCFIESLTLEPCHEQRAKNSVCSGMLMEVFMWTNEDDVASEAFLVGSN